MRRLPAMPAGLLAVGLAPKTTVAMLILALALTVALLVLFL
ncbi:MAG: hypothetical protein ACE5LS_03645 [Thermoplasmata archaeon]